MAEYSVAPRKEVHDLLETVDFNYVVVITYDSHRDILSNWWHFSGHPSDWKSGELSQVAQHMVSATAEYLKVDINNPSQRPIKIKQPVISRSIPPDTSKSDWGWLFGMSFSVKPPKRVWLSFWWSWSFIALAVSWGTKSFTVQIGPLAIVVGLHA